MGVLALTAVGTEPAHAAPISSVTLNGQSLGLRFDGIGALTQGGQQRLIYDYPASQQSEILDYLFCSPFGSPKPGYCTASGYGAAFSSLKVEIGGDGNEAEGAEPSMAHTSSELSSCHYRGYEWWLMQQAQDRNQNITFEAEPWGIPAWVGAGSGSHNDRTDLYATGSTGGVNYIIHYLQCAAAIGLPISQVGILNEDGSFQNTAFTSTPDTRQLTYIENLQAAIASNGLSTQIVCCDTGFGNPNSPPNADPYRYEMDTTADGGKNDTALLNAVNGLGYHYPRDTSTDSLSLDPAFDNFLLNVFQKPAWATEESTSGDLAFASPPPSDPPFTLVPRSLGLIGEWYGAGLAIQTLIGQYFFGAMTRADEIFYLNSFYQYLYGPGAGFISANEPWNGHYDVQPALWAIAHINQFAAPGWIYLGDQGSGCLDPSYCGQDPNTGAFDEDHGSYFSFTNGSNYSVVVQTINLPAAQTITFTITGGLTTAQVHLWDSSSSGQLIQDPDPTMNGNTFSVTFQPGHIYTLTTLTSRGKLTENSSPSQAPFPCATLTGCTSNWSDNFDGYTIGDGNPATQRDIPSYLSTMEGSFDLVSSSTCYSGSGCLEQMATAPSKRQFGSPQPNGMQTQWPLVQGEEPYAIGGDDNWTNYQVSVEAQFPSGSASTAAASVEGRVQPEGAQGLSFARLGGYEFRVQRSGAWWLVRWQADNDPNAAKVLTQGTWSGGDLGTNWHQLALSMSGATLKPSIDGHVLVTWTDTNTDSYGDAPYVHGLAGIGSGWNLARFDNLAVTQLSGNAQYDDHTVGSGLDQFNFTGTWLQCSCPSGDLDFMNTITSSNSANDAVTFKFTGRRIILFGARAQNGGYGYVSILNSGGTTIVPEQVADFYHEAFTLGDQVVYVSPLLPSGTYFLKVRVANPAVEAAGQPGEIAVGVSGVHFVHIDRADVL